MDVNVLRSLITVVTKSADKNVIYKALFKLRTHFVKNQEGISLFCNEGGIAPVVRLISKPYEKILEVSLSILGNCCTVKECSKQAISNGIVPPLLTILKSIPNPRVQSRACRLLGNLARESNEKLCTLAKGIGVVLASLLEDSKDTQTLSMAIRVVRLLWNEMPFCQEFVRFDGVEKILTILVRTTKAEVCPAPAQSIVEQNSFEKDRVEFMRAHIPGMERFNSAVFDREMMKTTRPQTDDAFHIPAAQEEKELVAEILRCLETTTISQLSGQRILYNFYANRNSISCIVCFAKDGSPFRAQSLKILSSLSKSNGQELLCSSDTDAVSVACLLLTRTLEQPLSDSEERHCVTIICMLAHDSCNRAKIRTSGAFKRILDLAKNTSSDSLLSMILIGLKHFRYDDYSIDLMIRMGLMNVLIERLELKTKDLTEVHEMLEGKIITSKKTLWDSNDESESCNAKRPKIEEISSATTNLVKVLPQLPSVESLSPSSSAVCIYSSPSSSPSRPKSPSPRGFSPLHKTDGYVYEDVDDYSPVVSDIEDGNDDETASNKTKKPHKDDTFNLIDQILNENSLHKDEEDDGNMTGPDEETESIKEKEPSSVDLTERRKTVELILNVLSTASARLCRMPFDPALCSQRTLNTLIQACRVAYRQQNTDTSWDAQGAPLVLSHLVNEKNFVSLLKHDFVFQVYAMAHPLKQHEDCRTCRDVRSVGRGLLNLLNKIAETGYGRGEMAHFLHKKDTPIHKQVSIISAMLIRDPKALHTLMLNQGGLYTLTDMILRKDEALCNEAATGLTAVAKQLNIQVPKPNTEHISKSQFILGSTQSFDDLKIDEEDKQDFVTFIAGQIAGGTNLTTDTTNTSTSENSIRFSERLLTENSDVFNRMFNSDFKESKDKRVLLKNQSIEGIRYFLECVEQMASSNPLRKPVNGITDQEGTVNVMKAVLEAYDISQMYLLPEIEKSVLNMIVYLLSADNLLDVFDFSIRYHKLELTEIAVNFFLTSNLPSNVKVEVFRKADASEFDKEWNDSIIDTVAYTCQHLTL